MRGDLKIRGKVLLIFYFSPDINISITVKNLEHFSAYFLITPRTNILRGYGIYNL